MNIDKETPQHWLEADPDNFLAPEHDRESYTNRLLAPLLLIRPTPEIKVRLCVRFPLEVQGAGDE